MRIATYNLRSGGTNKTHWSKVLGNFDPDLFLVQESYDPVQHLPTLAHGDLHRNACWEPVAGLKWGSAVYVKGVMARPLKLPDFYGHVVSVEVDGSSFPVCEGRTLRIFSVHAPDRGGYQRAVNSILDMIGKSRVESDLVIGGDFNLTVGKRLANEYEATSSADLAILNRMKDEFGLVSAWQSANAGLPLPQTLRWAKDKTIPYHCDGIFIPQNWVSQAQSCTVISGSEWDALSDHNPVIADFR